MIVDDDGDITITFKAGIEDNNDKTDTNKRIEVNTSNNPVVALSAITSVSGEFGVMKINTEALN